VGCCCQKFASIIRAIALVMEEVRASETSVNFYQTTQRNNPEDNHLLWKLRISVKKLTENYFAKDIWDTKTNTGFIITS
jgi:hypothetical protein